MQTDLSLTRYLSERLVAFTNPKADSTSFWRLAVWDASLNDFINSPLFGKGFGGYWHTFVPELNNVVSFSPHNLYIQTLVKIGLVGLFLYLIIVFKFYKKLRTNLVLLKDRIKDAVSVTDVPIIIFSIVVLISSHIYYLVYSLDYFSMLYIGLGAASILNYENGSKI